MASNPGGCVVAILGGGLSGLSAAYYILTGAAKRGIGLSKVLLIESQPRFGGSLRTVPVFRRDDNDNDNNDDHFELGPRTISINSYAGTNAIALVGDIGLARRVKYVPKNSIAFNRRYVAIDGRLFALPSGLRDLLRPISRPPFKPFACYMWKDFRTPPIASSILDPSQQDISVDRFFRYRFGAEIADYLANPLCAGITGGDSKTLSMRSLFPSIVEKEQLYGSVTRSMLSFGKRKDMDIYRDLREHSLVRKSIEQKWAVFSFDQGIETLPRRLTGYLAKNFGAKIRFLPETQIEKLTFHPHHRNEGNAKSKIEIDVKRNSDREIEKLEADHVFSSLPAFALERLLSAPNSTFGDLSNLRCCLRSISTVDMAVVSLRYEANVLPPQFDAFGFLVPARERSPILGVTFDSCIFPASNGTKLTVMLGGYRFTELFGSSKTPDPENVLRLSLDAVRRYLRIHAEPIRYLVTVHKNCIPQYTLGHSERIETIEAEISGLPLSLIGSSYRGFSVPDCILNAKLQANRWLNAQETMQN